MVGELEGSVVRAARLPAVALGLVLTLTSQGYGYFRDELYFRMLPPAWGYVDQPPLVPAVTRVLASVADQPWLLRVPATAAMVVTVFVVAAITREVGGSAVAQRLSAWAFAVSGVALSFGHAFLPSTVDLAVWALLGLLFCRLVLRSDARAWLWAGALVGAATYVRWLIVWPVLGLLVGLLAFGPRSALRHRNVAVGALIGLVVALPNVLYQATHGWPQLAMGQALSRANAGEVRSFMWVYLVVGLGPVLLPVWVAGLWSLMRRPQWRGLRAIVVAFGLVLVFTAVSGAQPYYPAGMLVVLLAVGAVPVAEWLAARPRWRVPAWSLGALNGLVSAVIGLPLLPVTVLGATPVPDVNPLSADQVGWPEYARQVADVWHRVPDRTRAIVLTSNYGEAGAIDRFGPDLGLPRPFSAHNALADIPPPPETTTVVFVGRQYQRATTVLSACTQITSLDNGVDVPNEEQGAPVGICAAPLSGWPQAWERLKHLD